MRLSDLLSDGMVLQRDAEAAVWGKTRPFHRVRIEFLDRAWETRADDQGRWKAVLQHLPPGGPHEMRIVDESGEERIIRDVLIGDVWVLGGQSNMELPVRRTLDLLAEEVRDVRLSQVRQFTVPLMYDFHGPREEVAGGRWIAAVGERVMDFSAAGFFFARELYERYGVPIGLILTAVGGTPVEAWMSEPTLRRLGGFDKLLDRCKDDAYVAATLKSDEERHRRWHEELNKRDAGRKEGWHRARLDTSDWGDFALPGSWRACGLENVRGAVWFRREFEIPSSVAEGGALLRLGTVVDADETYVNGVLVGSVPYRYPPRRYPIPAGVLKPGKNTIAVRVLSIFNTGEFISGMPYELVAGGRTLDLSGTWKYRLGAAAEEELAPQTFFQYMPAGVYNGMIAPVSRYAIKGVLWYQGESNVASPEGYSRLFREMVRDWRDRWKIGDFPFIFVQLANFADMDGGLERWAALREEQRKCLNIPNTAMAVAVDIGEPNDLHPQDKKTLGQRLALCARRLAHGEHVVHSGPLYRRMEREGDAVRIWFDHAGQGLTTRDGKEPAGFSVLGPDGIWRPARAVISGDTVLVSHERIREPRHVRYAWANHPAEANLCNREGLPAVPFSTET